VSDLEGAYKREKLDHEREKRFNRDIQIHEMELMDQITRVRKIMVSIADGRLITITHYHLGPRALRRCVIGRRWDDI
jgi:hypothetical protein